MKILCKMFCKMYVATVDVFVYVYVCTVHMYVFHTARSVHSRYVDLSFCVCMYV